MRILLDLDGVLVDFVGGACRSHGRPDPYTEPLDPVVAGKFDMEKIWGMDINEFWEPMTEPRWWEELEFMSDAKEILELCERAVGMDNVCLLTMPFRGSGPVVGKINWIERNMPEYSRRYLIGPTKQFCANSDSILVDDRNKNIEDFAEAGGNVVLVPRACNSNYRERHCATAWVKWCLENLS